MNLLVSRRMLATDSSLLEDGRIVGSRKNRTIMCPQCRRDKQKCNPVDRDWHIYQQKCERCSKLGYDCGPSERAPRKSRKSSSDTKTADLNHEEGSLTSSICITQDSPWSSPNHGDPASYIQNHFQCQTNGPSPAAPASTCMTPDLTIHGNQGIPQRSAESWTSELITQLGDLYATRELLRRELRICDQVESWTGPSEDISQVRVAIQEFIHAIQEDFEHCVKMTRYTMTITMASTLEHTMLELRLIVYKFANPPLHATKDQGVDEHGIGVSDRSSIQTLLLTLHETTPRHSVAEFICGGISHPAPISSLASTTKLYQTASIAVGRVLLDVVFRSFEHRKLFLRTPTSVYPDADTDVSTIFGYPACHLAAMHGHQHVAFKLWTSSPHRKWELDCFKRTPVHTAAYAGKVHELRSIFENSATTATDKSKDIFGLTPLMIAACKDDVKTFGLLQRHGADSTVMDPSGRNLLALAARNGSENIVRLLLCQGCIPQSLYPASSELYEAIAHDHNAVISLLIDHYSQHKTIDQNGLMQIQVAITAAKEKGLSDVVEQLENISATCSYNDADSVSMEASCIYPYKLERSPLESLTSSMHLQRLFTDDLNVMDWNQSYPCLQDLDWTDLGTIDTMSGTLSDTVI